MARIAVVHYIGATARSRSVVASLLADLVDEGHKVELLDISRFSVISQDLPRNLVARILGHKVFDNKFEETLAGLGVRHVLIGPASTAKPAATPELGMDARQAIDSELLTYFRRPSLIPETGAISAMRKNLTSMALACRPVWRRRRGAIQPAPLGAIPPALNRSLGGGPKRIANPLRPAATEGGGSKILARQLHNASAQVRTHVVNRPTPAAESPAHAACCLFSCRA